VRERKTKSRKGKRKGEISTLFPSFLTPQLILHLKDESVIQDSRLDVGKRVVVVSLLSILPRGKRPSLGLGKAKIQFQRRNVKVKEGMDDGRSDLAFLIMNPLPLV
jgi:hypothetical protein